ncbi:T9SS type A sorting domain-containing protein [Parvicella tangerina]|uniref:Secretion system C-terminal sorting domain-containing protein n=1 Tax=Parvicella tangerina TaxID=2829795 RepID=A0A916JJH1_9FLAO|nr:T9SS type A sorting domain-containing protein [Parvicella tangerina]CAG5077354.1 hypothetical protein CRYO30217_00359 [Parvicella tangerina]
MKKLLLPMCLSLSFLSSAQTFTLDTNSVSATLQTKGVLFNDFNNSEAGFEALQGDGTTTIFSTSLWMAGKNVNNQIYGSIGTYGQNTESYITGPLSIIQGTDTTAPEPYGAATITSSVQQQYNQIYTITSHEISLFRSYMNCLNDPLCDENLTFPGYTIPPSILNWPAHGDLSQGYDFFLTPYYDIDGDQVYNPQAGDYPCIKGDKYALIILNDKNPNNSTIDPVGIEIHVEVYAFDRDISSPVDRTIFVGYDIINRSTQLLKDFYVGVFADLDIGCGTDDFIGSIPELNSFFGYNASMTDNTCFSNIGYGATPPAQGVVFLNQDMASCISFHTGSSGYSSMPSTPSEYYNCLQGKFKDGTTMYYGGDGHTGSSGVTTTPTSFQYPENPPAGFQPWTEFTQGNTGGDRTVLGSLGKDTLRPGDVIELDLAYLYSRAASGDNLSSIQTLQNEIPLIQQFYDDSIQDCFSGDLSLSVAESNEPAFSVYPNPFNDRLIIDNAGNEEALFYAIYNNTGQLIDKGRVGSNSIVQHDTSQLPSGAYLTRIYNEKLTLNYSKVLIK